MSPLEKQCLQSFPAITWRTGFSVCQCVVPDDFAMPEFNMHSYCTPTAGIEGVCFGNTIENTTIVASWRHAMMHTRVYASWRYDIGMTIVNVA